MIRPGVLVIDQPGTLHVEDLRVAELAQGVCGAFFVVAGEGIPRGVLEEGEPGAIEAQAPRGFGVVVDDAEHLPVDRGGLQAAEEDRRHGHGAGEAEQQTAEVVDRRRQPDHPRGEHVGANPKDDQGHEIDPDEAEHVGPPRHRRGVVRDHLRQRLVEVERDDPGEHHVEEHQGRAPGPLARQRIGHPQDQDGQREVNRHGGHRRPRIREWTESSGQWAVGSGQWAGERG